MFTFFFVLVPWNGLEIITLLSFWLFRIHTTKIYLIKPFYFTFYTWKVWMRVFSLYSTWWHDTIIGGYIFSSKMRNLQKKDKRKHAVYKVISLSSTLLHVFVQNSHTISCCIPFYSTLYDNSCHFHYHSTLLHTCSRLIHKLQVYVIPDFNFYPHPKSNTKHFYLKFYYFTAYFFIL